MNILALSIVLIWLGGAALVVVLWQRIRKGAWQPEALDAPPPVAVWVMLLAGLGLGLTVAGIVLAVWAFL